MSDFTPFKKFHPATKDELARWSTFSRNTIGPVLTRLGVMPLGKRYPMIRIYAGLLGMTPDDQEDEDTLGAGLIRTSRVANMIGTSVDVLHAELRRTSNPYPPMFVFGPKRHMLLRAQVHQMLSSPRNDWHPIEIASDHAVPASRLARHLGVSEAKISAVLADKSNLPAHVIVRGSIHFVIADVKARLSEQLNSRPAPATQTPEAPAPLTAARPATAGPAVAGAPLFKRAIQRSTGHAQAAPDRTQSGPDAHRGDRAHTVCAEAKLSDT
ncbi:hypothetical protein E4Z66_18955 [Aliishimia ponticola]|uniref:Uncharacterized protein n=1 Tax=Aliishimia ponticola TaxID=2499833 RepID=A0A4S4N5C9_9RHOB|nr:hypothetical protein [Aliishimia ponticola]THH34279.1 hypothetical protein E4Z66_18955 [Aliishimia ponticola]